MGSDMGVLRDQTALNIRERVGRRKHSVVVFAGSACLARILPSTFPPRDRLRPDLDSTDRVTHLYVWGGHE